MRVLFLLSCLEPSGSETYCVSLAHLWKGVHEIFWISDELHYQQHPYTPMAISRKAFPGGLFNTLKVAAFIRKHKIQIIHSHSRRSHWVAAQAAALTGIPHVTTIHQPPPVHLFSRLFPCLGDVTIAIDEAVAEHLAIHFKIDPAKIRLIRNGIDLRLFSPSLREMPGLKKILIVGRLSGGRWAAFDFVLRTLERVGKSLPPALYHVLGRIPDERQAELERESWREKLTSSLNSSMAPATIQMMGFVQEPDIAIRNADAVIAGGRSAIESLANSRPAILLGEGGVLGLCEPSTWKEAARSNFGDHLAPKRFDERLLEQALRRLLGGQVATSELVRWGRAQVETQYDVFKIGQTISNIYKSLA